MKLNPLLAFDIGSMGVAALVTVGILFVIFVFIITWASRYTKVGPNEVLIVSGRKKKVIDPDGIERERASASSRAAARSSSRSWKKWTSSRSNC